MLMGKWLLITGILLIVVGLVVIALEKLTGGAKLPGDIIFRKDNFTFYFPLATSIIISLILSLLFYLINKLR